MNTVLVISIGKSPDPCLASVQQHNAKRVIFFASQETRASVTDIERVLEMQGELVAPRYGAETKADWSGLGHVPGDAPDPCQPVAEGGH